jgi:hypothetical protein
MPGRGRDAVNRLLWAAAKKLGGEETVRTAVAAINDRDGTNAELRGTPEYSSTKRLTDQQFLELAMDFRRKAKLPMPSLNARAPRDKRPRHPPSDVNNVIYVATPVEKHYVEYLFDLLSWSDEARAAFIERQTKKRGLATHAAVTAVVAPLERLLRERGFRCFERDRQKTWRAPNATRDPDACCDDARVVSCVCRKALSCPTHGEKHVGGHD